jgi:hypothetical protein
LNHAPKAASPAAKEVAMNRTLTILGACAIAGMAWSPGALAQYSSTPATRTPEPGYSAVTARIVDVDVGRREITLDNGMRVRVPERLQNSWAMLKPGNYVRVEYRPEGTSLIASTIEPVAATTGMATPGAVVTTPGTAVVTTPSSGTVATAPSTTWQTSEIALPGQPTGQLAGRVVSSEQVLTLDDGTKLALRGVPPDWRIQPGSYVQGQYRMVNGERVLTSVNVGPGPTTGTAAVAPTVTATATLGNATAPAATAAAPATTYGTPETLAANEVEGRIASVVPNRREITLDNGITLNLPDDLALNWDKVEQGSHVRAMYRPSNGQNVVTAMQLTPKQR